MTGANSGIAVPETWRGRSLPSEPWQWTAREAVAALTDGRASAAELIDVAADRIAAVDGKLNALPTRCFDRARARAAEGALAGTMLGGLPLAIKDLVDVAGVRTTLGSPIYADRVPERSDSLVTRLEARGGVVVAKANTPEFGAGANTFNPVFGTTLNPWNTDLTPGGSSGGSAAALAAGLVWLAHGSDLGGSLRTPAAFTGTVGLRPTAGLVGRGPRRLPFEELFVDGPMGRTVEDVALFLDALAGVSPTDGLSRAGDGDGYLSAALRPALPTKVAYSPGLGLWPVDPGVRAVLDRAVDRLADAGVEIVTDLPDLSSARQVFHILRGVLFAAEYGALLERERDRIKPDVVWNIEAGQAFTGAEIGWAMAERGRLLHAMADFMDGVDLLLSAAALVPPFPPAQRFVDRVGDQKFDTYIDWLGVTFAISLVNLPALCLPCGLDGNGLPVGLQAVGGPRGEARLLSHAAALEDLFDTAGTLPLALGA